MKHLIFSSTPVNGKTWHELHYHHAMTFNTSPPLLDQILPMLELSYPEFAHAEMALDQPFSSAQTYALRALLATYLKDAVASKEVVDEKRIASLDVLGKRVHLNLRDEQEALINDVNSVYLVVNRCAMEDMTLYGSMLDYLPIRMGGY